jgi:amidase
LDRRRFLHLSGAAGLLTLDPRLGAASRAAEAAPGTAASATIAAGLGRTAQAPASSTPAFELNEATVVSLQEAMTSGRLTARDIAERYLARIASIDAVDKTGADKTGADKAGRGPALNSVLETNPDALAIADALDRERKAKGPRGPLHGIPILLKDNIDTADKMKTSAGSLALADSIAPRDAFLVERLRAAGAVILGKTNLSEWANFRSDSSSSGWSGRGGQTRNPYALDRNPCGSSSGSGAAIAANLCAIAVGTETDGSIVCPSGINGIVGIKPTVGLISRAGVIPISATQDTAGPMTRTVADAAALLTALAGVDPRDAATTGSGRHISPDYRTALDPAGLKGARIGVARKGFNVSDQVTARFAEAIQAMKSAGAIIIDPADIPHMNKVGDPEFQVLLYEFKAGLNAYLATTAPNVQTRTLASLIAFNEAHKDREMPFFAQETFIKAEKKGPLTTKEYLVARQTCRRLSRTLGLDAVMTTHRLDAIVAPTNGPSWLTDHVNGDRFTGGSSTPAAVSGYPSITVPMGDVHGLPVGISFIGRAWSEPVLIKLAYAFEQETKARKAPKFLRGVEV